MGLNNSEIYKGTRIPNISEEIDMLEEIPESERSEDWKRCITQAKKSLESALYRFVVNGCETERTVKGAFPELETQYDPESYSLLDEKIKVLSAIAEMGPESDYKNVPGFDDILEEKTPRGEKEIVFD